MVFNKDIRILGVDCSETFVGLNFCYEQGLRGVVLLYCSDNPRNKIAQIPAEEFKKRALKRDLEMHMIAKDFLKGI